MNFGSKRRHEGEKREEEGKMRTKGDVYAT